MKDLILKYLNDILYPQLKSYVSEFIVDNYGEKFDRFVASDLLDRWWGEWMANYQGSEFIKYDDMKRFKDMLTEMFMYVVAMAPEDPTKLSGYYDGGWVDISEPRATLYVDKSSTIAKEDGSWFFPFKSIQSAIDAAEEYYAICIRKGTYDEELSIDGKSNLHIYGEEPHGVEVVQDTRVQNTSSDISFRGLKANELYLSNGGLCSFQDMECDLINGSGNYQISGKCNIRVIIGLSASTVSIVNAFFSNVPVFISNGNSKIINVNKICLDHRGGDVDVTDSIFIEEPVTYHTTAILSTSNTGSLNLYSGIALSPISKTGTCPYSIGSFIHASNDVFTGNRLDVGLRADDVIADHTPINYTTSNSRTKAHLAGIDGAIGGIKTDYTSLDSKLTQEIADRQQGDADTLSSANQHTDDSVSNHNSASDAHADIRQKVDNNLTEAKGYTDSKVAEIEDRLVHDFGAFATPEDLIAAHPTANAGDMALVMSTDTVWTWSTSAGGWVDTDKKGEVTDAQFQAHVNNATAHVTADEKNSWNNKANEISSFTEATSRVNINSGDSVTTMWGKIRKFFTDLKAVAFSGSYNDLADKPTIPNSDDIVMKRDTLPAGDDSIAYWQGLKNGIYFAIPDNPVINAPSSYGIVTVERVGSEMYITWKSLVAGGGIYYKYNNGNTQASWLNVLNKGLLQAVSLNSILYDFRGGFNSACTDKPSGFNYGYLDVIKYDNRNYIVQVAYSGDDTNKMAIRHSTNPDASTFTEWIIVGNYFTDWQAAQIAVTSPTSVAINDLYFRYNQNVLEFKGSIKLNVTTGSGQNHFVVSNMPSTFKNNTNEEIPISYRGDAIKVIICAGSGRFWFIEGTGTSVTLDMTPVRLSNTE